MHETFVIPASGTDPAFFRLCIAGTSFCDGSYRIERCGNPVTVLEYVERGRGKLMINGNWFEPSAGSLYLVPPGSRHLYFSSADDPWVKHWFNLKGEFLHSLLRIFHLEKGLHLPGFSRGELFTAGLSAIAGTEPEMQQQRAFEVISGILFAVRQELSVRRQCRQPVSPEGRAMMHCLRNRLGRRAPSLQELAGVIRRSPSQAIRIFRRDFGTTPGEFLRKLKAETAAELLSSSAKTIKEIAAIVGYDDPYYFARIFKQEMRESPGRYRRLRQSR